MLYRKKSFYGVVDQVMITGLRWLFLCKETNFEKKKTKTKFYVYWDLPHLFPFPSHFFVKSGRTVKRDVGLQNL